LAKARGEIGVEEISALVGEAREAFARLSRASWYFPSRYWADAR
jgi:hypothetical protein